MLVLLENTLLGDYAAHFVPTKNNLSSLPVTISITLSLVCPPLQVCIVTLHSLSLDTMLQCCTFTDDIVKCSAVHLL